MQRRRSCGTAVLPLGPGYQSRVAGSRPLGRGFPGAPSSSHHHGYSSRVERGPCSRRSPLRRSEPRGWAAPSQAPLLLIIGSPAALAPPPFPLQPEQMGATQMPPPHLPKCKALEGKRPSALVRAGRADLRRPLPASESRHYSFRSKSSQRVSSLKSSSHNQLQLEAVMTK